MMRISILVLLLFINGITLTARAQNVDALIASKIRMVEQGNAGQVKTELPALVSKYQNHPGVLYIQGLLATNGVEAAKYYQMVLDNFPRSEWADDALYRIHLYYYSLGLARTAELKMKQMRAEYPNSPYLRERPLPAITEHQEPEVTPIPTIQPPPVLTEEVEPLTGGYTIQVGAFASIENAMKLKTFFEELGHPVEVQNKVRGGRSLHLVWVGRFQNSDEARKFGREVKTKHNIESIVVTR